MVELLIVIGIICVLIGILLPAILLAKGVTTAPLPDKINRVGPAESMVFMADGPLGFSSTLAFKPTALNAGNFNPAPRHRGKLNIAFMDGHVVCLAYPNRSIL